MRALIIIAMITGINLSYADQFKNLPKIETKKMPIGDNPLFETIDPYELNSFNKNFNKYRGEGFPHDNVRAYDPINRKRYEKVYVGQTHKAGWFKDYDYWRYITVYNSKKVKKRMQNFLSITEDCHDKGWNVGSWDQTTSISVTLGSKFSAEVLGIGAEVSMAITAGHSFSVRKSIQGTLGLRATHVPYRVTEEQVGMTYIQVYSKKTNKLAYLVNPGFGYNAPYPYAFKLTGQNPSFHVQREDVEKCEGYESDETSKSPDNSDFFLDTAGVKNY